MKWNGVGGGFDGDAARAGRLGIGENFTEFYKATVHACDRQRRHFTQL